MLGDILGGIIGEVVFGRLRNSRRAQLPARSSAFWEQHSGAAGVMHVFVATPTTNGAMLGSMVALFGVSLVLFLVQRRMCQTMAIAGRALYRELRWAVCQQDSFRAVARAMSSQCDRRLPTRSGVWPLLSQLAVIAVLLAWTGLAFWAFSFSYSSSFFQYSRPSRLPPFVAALLAVLIPISGVRQWRRVRLGKTSALRAWIAHALAAAASLAPLALVAAILARAPDPWRLSGDDAMGVGLNFLGLAALGVASALILGVALAMRDVDAEASRDSKTDRPSGDEP